MAPVPWMETPLGIHTRHRLAPSRHHSWTWLCLCPSAQPHSFLGLSYTAQEEPDTLQVHSPIPGCGWVKAEVGWGARCPPGLPHTSTSVEWENRSLLLCRKSL